MRTKRRDSKRRRKRTEDTPSTDNGESAEIFPTTTPNAYAEIKHDKSSSPHHHSNPTEIWISQSNNSAQPQHISNRENRQTMIPVKEGSTEAAHRKVEIRATRRHRQDRKKERKDAPISRSLCTQPEVVGKNLTNVQCAKKKLTHAAYRSRRLPRRAQWRKAPP